MFDKSYCRQAEQTGYMEHIEALVPKNKFDLSGIEKFRMLSDEEIAPILPALLEWMKDMNWPIAKEMPGLLSKHQRMITPCIIEALQPEQSECDWKNYIILDLLPMLDKQYLVMIKPCLERIVKNPTQGEILEGTDIEAMDFLKKMRKRM